MSKSIITVEQLGKRFIIGHQKARKSDTFQEMIMNRVKSIGSKWRNKNPSSNGAHEDFWALHDVSFEVKAGERIGIIGRNGAGKSTLLKILSRITEPTTGSVKLRGKVASLLEVGTGFHPELSGRENIYLNGAILGMSRQEIRKQFDEIVEFAEIEKFLDTPVKRYSSGMYVRLAFAIAAHLEPEILIVDEVLAVGDVQFQKKCLGKMEEVSKDEGRTLLFVSHNLSAIKSLCSKLIYLKNGQLVKMGEVEDTISEYLSEHKIVSATGRIPVDFYRPFHTGHAYFRKVIITGLDNDPLTEIPYQQQFKIVSELDVLKDIDDVCINFIITSNTGDNVGFIAENAGGEYSVVSFKKGKHEIQVVVDAVLLPLHYNITATVSFKDKGTTIDYVENVREFKVSKIGLKVGEDYPWDPVYGYVQLNSKWTYSTKQHN